MKIAVMQPYFMPYIGYFQLIKSVDKFVACDDVQYIKGGWINRNRILLNNEPKMFTLSIKKDHQYLNINERFFTDNFEEDKRKFFKLIEREYKKAPYYNETISILNKVFDYDPQVNISKFIIHSLKEVCRYIGINTEFFISSDIKKDQSLKCQDKVIDLVKKMNGDIYINSIGGTKLYSKEVFKKNGIDLYFIKEDDIKYKQFENIFVPNLSIIDVMMFNSTSEIQELLDMYRLI